MDEIWVNRIITWVGSLVVVAVPVLTAMGIWRRQVAKAKIDDAAAARTIAEAKALETKSESEADGKASEDLRQVNAIIVNRLVVVEAQLVSTERQRVADSERLTGRINELEARVQTDEVRLQNEIRLREELGMELKTSRERVHELSNQLAATKLKLSSVEEEMKKEQEKNVDLVAQRDSLTARVTQLELQLAELTAEKT
jgi:hypothetical protein